MGATALAAKDSNSQNGMVLQGPGGCLVVDGNPNSLPAVYSLLGAQRDDCVRTDGPAAPRHRMAYEFAEFARIIAAHDTAAETAARLRTMHVMELLELLELLVLPDVPPLTVSSSLLLVTVQSL